MSKEKTINSTIRTNLLANEDFVYAHLVKFERPFKKDSATNAFGTEANRYAYYTDGSHDITYDDGSGNGDQVYKANRLLSVGNYSETTQARASSISLVLAGEDLKPSLTMSASISNAGVVAPALGNANLYEGDTLDFVERGFKEGDKIRFKSSSIDKVFIIDSFLSNNTALQLARTGTDTNDSDFDNSGTGPWTISLASEELTAPLQDRGITISGTSAASPNFVNREVMIYKVFIDPETGLLWGNSGITVFKGLIQNVSISEDPKAVKVTWGITSHWGDWSQVGGRLTTDELHRNLQPNGIPAKVQPVRNEYASDLGFLHAETSLSAIANYTTQETRTKVKNKRRGGIAGALGGKYAVQIEYQVDLQHELDLNIHLQGKYLPVVYGVQRVNGNPIFADTLSHDSKVVYTADAICEGEIHGLYNIYIDDVPLICTDDNDYDVRRVGGADADNTQLQCYGRMSHGQTLTGKEGNPADENDAQTQAQALALYAENYEVAVRGSQGYPTRQDYISGLQDDYKPAGSLAAGSQGLLHRKSYEISGTHNIQSSFFAGRANQLASSMLYQPSLKTDGIEGIRVTNAGRSYTGDPTVAISAPVGGGTTATGTVVKTNNDEGNAYKVGSIKITNPGSGYTDSDTPTVIISGGNGFGARATAHRGGYKRQIDYYEGSDPYWSSNHRLLDTAYSSTRFELDADRTEIPEIEYVVKGSLLDCYNYDNTYAPDEVLNPQAAGDIITRANAFSPGDLVNVEYSTDGSNWTNDTSGTSGGKFKIMDKYLFQTNRQTTQYKFRLDSAPALAVTNGAPGRTRLRLKNADNDYWYMVTWNYTLCENKTFPNEWKAPANDGSSVPQWAIVSNKLTGTFSSADATLLGKAEDYTAYQFLFSGTAAELLTMPDFTNSLIPGTWSGDVLTLDVILEDLTSTALNLIKNKIKIKNGKTFKMTDSSITGITNKKELFNSYEDADFDGQNRDYGGRGALLKNTSTNEEREIVDFNTTSDTITIETPFYTPPGLTDKFTITGRGVDKRSSNNPAMQTLDYLSNKRYGKGLTSVDLDIDSFISSAKLCDARSDITIRVETVADVVVGDVFELKTGGSSNSGTLVAQGTVAIGGINTTTKTLTLTNVIGKFTKKYSTYGDYQLGDIIYTSAGHYYRAGSTVTNTSSVQPNHESGTTNGMEYLGKYTDNTGAGTIVYHKTAGDGTRTSLNLEKRYGKPVEYALYDSDWVRYWRYYGWDRNHQAEVTRHQTNFILDTGKSQFANINSLLSHFNGILSYENGKYVLDVETQESAPTISLNSTQENINPYYIENSDIIGKLSLKDDSQKKGKNTIKASVADPQNNWGSRSITFFNSDFLKADRDIAKTANFAFTGITNYWNGRIGVEKELFQSRFSKEINFTIGVKGLLLKVGQVIAVSYDSFGWSSKLFRIDNLNFNANCTVAIKATEYHDSIYEITKQQSAEVDAQSGANFSLQKIEVPTLSSVSTDKAGSVILNWINGANFNELTDSTEIYAATSNDRNTAILIALVDNAENYAYTTTTAATHYYWIRHRRITYQGNKNQILRSSYVPTSATGGRTGTSLSISAGAVSVNLIPSSHVIDFTKVGTEASTITFTTQTFNIDGTPYFEFLVGTSTIGNILPASGVRAIDSVDYDGDEFRLPQANEPGDGDAPVQVTVKVRQGSASGTIIAQDTVTIFTVKDGQSTITGLLTNEAHVVPTTNDGTVTLVGGKIAGAGGTFKVFYGNQDITTNAKTTFSIPGGSLTTGTITAAITSPQGVYSISALGSDAATVTFRCLIKGSLIGGVDGTNDETRDVIYSIAKAKKGNVGAGTAGLNQKTVALYYLNNDDSSAPTLPNNDLFWNFTERKLVVSSGSTTTLSDGHASLDDWVQALPNTTSTNGVRWVTMAVASANTAEDTISAGDWAAPAVHGADGVQHAKIDLYQKTSSDTAPALPNNNLYYNFAVGALVENGTTTKLADGNAALDSWKLTIPTTSGNHLHHTSAVALANTSATQDTIDEDDWSGVAVLSQIGSNGAASKVVKLTVDDYSIVYAADGTTPSPSGNMTLTATSQNFTDAYFKFTGDGISDETSYSDGSGANVDTFTFPEVTNHFATPKSLKVSVQEGNSGGEVAFDTITIHAVKPGAAGDDAHTGFLTNSAHVVAANNDGTGYSYTGAGGKFERYDGASDKTGSDTTYAVGTSGTAVAETKNGLTMTITQSTGVYVLSGGSWTSDSETFTLRAIFDSVTVTSIYTISKSKKGAGGSPAKTVIVTPSAQFQSVRKVWVDRGFDTFRNPNVITITAQTTNTTANGAWSTSAGTLGNIDNAHAAPSCTVTGSGLVDGMTVTYTLASADGSGTDATTLEVLDNTSTDVTVILSNESHTLVAASNGAVSSYTGSGTTITAFQGTEPLDFDGAGSNQGTFNVAVQNVADITEGSLSAQNVSGSNSNRIAVVGDHSGAANGTDSYVITYTISGKRTDTASGTAFSQTKTQTISKAKAGADGSGLNSANVQLFKATTTTTVPAHPDNTLTFNFTNVALTVNDGDASLDGWLQARPVKTSGQYLWSTIANISSENNTVTIAVADWDDAVLEVGAEEPRDIRYVVLYHDASSSLQAKPSVPSNIAYNFNTGAFTNLPSGWSIALGTAPYTVMVATIKEATFEGTQTITFTSPYFIGTNTGYNTEDNYNEGNTSQMNALSNPKGGDLFYNTTEAAMYTYNETA